MSTHSVGKVTLAIAATAFGLFAATSSASSDFSWHDQLFAKKAAQSGMAEVQLGQLAARQGSSQKVKEFGRRMVDEHTRANGRLKAVADKEKLVLPSNLSAVDKALLTRLSRLSGDAFDKAYLSAIASVHQTDVALFEQEVHGGMNEPLKAFASEALPVLKAHLSESLDLSRGIHVQ